MQRLARSWMPAAAAVLASTSAAHFCFASMEPADDGSATQKPGIGGLRLTGEEARFFEDLSVGAISRAGHADQHLIHANLKHGEGVRMYEAFYDASNKRLIAVVQLGDKLCGYPGIVHGGASAALLDDAYGMLFFSLGLGLGFTARLEIDYRKPIPAGSYAVLTLRLQEQERRKVWLQGEIRVLPSSAEELAHVHAGDVMEIAPAVQSRALFVLTDPGKQAAAKMLQLLPASVRGLLGDSKKRSQSSSSEQSTGARE